MSQNMVNPQDLQLSIDEITSPIGAQLLEFCESELFSETMQNSEVDSSSNCCYEEQSSYPANPSSVTPEMNQYNNSTNIDNDVKPRAKAATGGTSTLTVVATARNSNLPIIFDEPPEDQMENDISASIDFTPSPLFSTPHNQCFSNNNNNTSDQEPFSISSLNNQLSIGDLVSGPLHMAHQLGQDQWPMAAPLPSGVVPILGPPLPASYEEECLPSMPSYTRPRSSQSACSLIDPMMGPYLSSASGGMSAPFPTENPGVFCGNALMLGTDLSHQELEFQGDNAGLFLPDNMQRVLNCSSELQALGSESQHPVHGGGARTTPLASEISSLEDPTFKVGKLSVEERKRKIHRYMKKRNERNFSKKIKYACRKTLADSRPRVRGRFAKNDELVELARTNGSNHEDDTDEDVSLFSNSIPDQQRKVCVKEDGMDSSDIFAHMSGVNSFKCNYPIQSWI